MAEFHLGKNPGKLEEYVSGLYDAHREEVFRYLHSRGVRPAEAREICQEAFLRLFAALCRGETVRNPRAWVFAVAHNCGVNAAIAGQGSELAAPEAEADLPADGPNPEEILLQKEELMRLHRAIGGLPRQQRQFIKLRTAGLRYAEIAEINGVTVGTVAQSLFRALNRLRKVLYEE